MLDIIIPSYKDIEGLKRTLNSIDNNNVTITVVDDCSGQDLSNIIVDNIFYLKKNSGPGVARQYGIDHTKEPYITFIDAGDCFEKGILEKILQTIKDNPNEQMYSWSHTNNHGRVYTYKKGRVLGNIYKRDFLSKYNITFCAEGSYANEDIGFNRTCIEILKSIEKQPMCIEENAILKIEDDNSITHTQLNGIPWGFFAQNMGLATNLLYCIDILKKNNVIEESIVNLSFKTFIELYHNFVRAMIDCPSGMQKSWDGARLFYLNSTKQYIEQYNTIFTTYWSYELKRLREKYKENIKPNIKRFCEDLENNINVPQHYYLENNEE